MFTPQHHLQTLDGKGYLCSRAVSTYLPTHANAHGMSSRSGAERILRPQPSPFSFFDQVLFSCPFAVCRRRHESPHFSPSGVGVNQVLSPIAYRSQSAVSQFVKWSILPCAQHIGGSTVRLQCIRIRGMPQQRTAHRYSIQSVASSEVDI